MILTITNNPEALQIGLWVIASTAVLQALGSAVSLAKFFANRSERRQVSISPDILGRPDFDTHVAENKQEHQHLFAKIGGAERGITAHLNAEIKSLRDERREDIHSLHREMNEIARKVSGLEATNTLQSQRLAEISAKLDRMIERHNSN
jgi:hypothetical protein